MASGKTKTVDKSVERHLLDKRDELIWALNLQGYKGAEIGRIFNSLHRSAVNQIVRRKPKDYRPKWVKVQE